MLSGWGFNIESHINKFHKWENDLVYYGTTITKTGMDSRVLVVKYTKTTKIKENV